MDERSGPMESVAVRRSRCLDPGRHNVGHEDEPFFLLVSAS